MIFLQVQSAFGGVLEVLVRSFARRVTINQELGRNGVVVANGLQDFAKARVCFSHAVIFFFWMVLSHAARSCVS